MVTDGEGKTISPTPPPLLDALIRHLGQEGGRETPRNFLQSSTVMLRHLPTSPPHPTKPLQSQLPRRQGLRSREGGGGREGGHGSVSKVTRSEGAKSGRWFHAGNEVRLRLSRPRAQFDRGWRKCATKSDRSKSAPAGTKLVEAP